MSAERILSEMESVREELKQLGRWGSGRLRLGAPAAACQYLLPAVLREFRESFPACRISIEAGDTSEVVEMLHARRIDLALVLEPRGEPQIEFRPLFTDELQFVASQQLRGPRRVKWMRRKFHDRAISFTIRRATPSK